MNIDLLPFTSFALQSCAVPAPAKGQSNTLTLQLDALSGEAHEPMSGRAGANQTWTDNGDVLRAWVAQAQGDTLTITF